MIKLLLFLVLIVVNQCAQAEWIGIGKTQDGVGHFYANPRSIENSDDIVRVWTLADFEKIQKVSKETKAFKSYMLRLEIDCIKNMSRYISLFVFAENMGKGEAVLSDNHEYAWEPTSDSRILKLFEVYACKKKK